MLRTFQTNGKGSFSTKTLLCFFLFLIGISKSHAQTTLFSEDWASSSFATNGWTFDPSQGAWVMGSGYTPTGATTPNAYFNWTPSYTNYSYSLVSPVINGSTYVGMTLDYKLQLNNYSASTLEQFKIEYKKTWETAWTLLTNYSNAAGSFNIAPTNVPISGTDTANYQIRFVAYGVSSFNINGWGLDDIAIKGTPSTLCFGTPTVGILSGPSSVCPNTAFTVSSTGYTSATGISFQWESSPSGLGVWTAVGTNSPSLSVTPITAATDYRLTISCANGGGTDVSPAVTVNVSAYYNCYCSSSASYTGDEEILNVTLGTLNNSSTCATTAPGSGSVNQRYSNYSTLAPTVLYTGATNPLSVQVGTCGGNYGNWTKVYIDYNHDGSFTGVGEEVYSSTTYTTGPHFEIGSITIPSTATTGVTGMRVINVETTSSLSVNPCGTYGWGETEDYLIDIQTPPTCAGTPSLATVSGPVSVCPNASFNVSATGYSQGLGITYQWETAAGSTNAWSPIAGATNPYLTVTGGITGAMDYHLITTCNNGGAQDVSNTTTVATMPFYVCYCGPATGISLNSYTYNIVTNVSILGTPLNNTTSLAGTGGYTLNYPTTATTTTSLSQGLAYSIDVSMPFTGYYVGVWVDFDANGSFDASEFVTMSGTGTTLTGVFTVPLTAIVGQTGLRVRGFYSPYTATQACQTYDDYETEDYIITIDPSVACSGTPSPGAITTPLVNLCPNTAFTVTGGNVTTGIGVSYQWQSRPTGGANPWVNIAGATNTYYTESAGVNVITDYQLITSCSIGGSSNTSNILTIYQLPFYNCYCTSMATQTGDEEIYSVTVNSTNSNTFSGQGNGCSTAAPGPGSILNRYSNFTSLGTFVQMMQGSTASFTIEENECDGAPFYAFGTSIWVDFNQNGSYSDAGEQVFVETATATGPRNVNGTFLVPLTATTGQTGMRIIAAEGISGASLTPCLSFGYGETEDYIVDITLAVGCTGTPLTPTASGPSSICPNSSFSLNATGYSVASGMTFQWESAAAGTGTWTAISGATSINYTVSGGITAATDYHLVTTCTNSGSLATSNTVSVSVNPFYNCYCSTSNQGGPGSLMNQIDFGTISNNTSATNPTAIPYYSSFPSLTTNVTAGSSVPLTVTIGPSGTYTGAVVSVWIDYNQNGVYAANEWQQVGLNCVAGTATTINVNIPATATLGTTGMRIRSRGTGNQNGANDACLSMGSGETEDYNITIVAGTACTGTPAVVTASGPANACANVVFNLNATGYTIGSGISYQWESSAPSAGVWSAIAGATTPMYSVTAFTAAADYRFVTTCSNSGLSDNSNTVSVALNPATACYCAPSVSVQDELISNMTFDTYSNPNTGFGTAGYQDFTSMTPIAVTGGSSYSFSASISPFYSSDAVAVWIDFNQDGTFANPGERVLLNAPSASPASGTITIPATAMGGLTRMRVRLDYANSNPSPCGNSSYGNIEDYMVNITPAVVCTGTPSITQISGATGVCSNTAFTLIANGYSVANGITYSWESSPAGSGTWTPITGATTTTYSSAGITTATDFRFITTCTSSTLTDVSNTLSVSMNSATQCYCIPLYNYGCSYGDDINTFTLTGENGTSFNDVNTGCSTGSYDNRTAQSPVDLSLGTTYNGTINSDYYSSEYANIWIDFGNDGVFDASDAVGSVDNFGTTTANYTISIPATATIGQHRMRVRCAFAAGTGSSIDPCTNYYYGETHDYTVNIDTVSCAAPSVSISASNTTICMGTTVNFTATGVDGGSTPTYQWMLNNAPIAGETNSTYSSSTLDDVDVVSCEMTSSCNTSLSSLSNDIIMSVLPIANPDVLAVESANSVCAGTSITFTAIPTDGGASPAYQWFLNGAALVGETNGTYTSSSLSDVDVVSVDMTTSELCYNVQTASSNDIIMSITPLANPSVIASESINYVCPGTTVAFTAMGTDGGTNPTYQWYLNGTAITGETNDNYSSSSLSNGDVVSVDMTTSETCYTSQTATSNAITMYVNAAATPTVTAMVASTSVCTGAMVNFSSVATDGGSSPSYQWYLNGIAIFGETNDSYSSSSVSNGDTYAVEMTSSAGCVTTSTVMSNDLTMSVSTASAAVSASGPLALCSGGSVTLTASSGASYSWSNGATTQSISVNTAGSYSVTVVDNSGCVAMSSDVHVLSKTMPTLVKIKTIGATTVCDPAKVGFSVDPSASSLYGFNFQWNLNGSAITGATDTSYTASGASAGNITLTVSGSTCTKNSAAKTYTIKPLPVATFTAAGPTTFCNGGSVTLTAPTITGYTYSWLKDGASAGAGASKVFKLSGVYTVIATLGGCKDTADISATVVVNALPVAAVASITPITFCSGDSCIMNATPTGGTNYAWINGTVTVNTTVPTYTSMVTGTYKVVVTDVNGCVSKTSTTSVKTKVNPIPTALISASGSTTISATGNVKLNASPSTGVTWQWSKNGVVISGATTKQYIATTGGSYTVAVTKLGCVGTSAATVVTQTGVKEETGTTNSTEMSFELSAYPNPVNDLLTVNVRGIENVDATIQVMDFNGRLVSHKEMKQASTTVDMTGFASGVYLIRYKDNDGRTGTIKVTKQ